MNRLPRCSFVDPRLERRFQADIPTCSFIDILRSIFVPLQSVHAGLTTEQCCWSRSSLVNNL